MTKRICIAVFLAALGALSLTGMAHGKEDGVVASMGDIRIKAADVRSLLSFQEDGEMSRLADNPSLLADLIKNEAIRRAILVEGKKRGWEKDPKVSYLIERQKDQLLIDIHLAEMAKVPLDFPSGGEVERFYKSNAGSIKSPATVRLAQIYVSVAYDAPEAMQKEASKKIIAIWEELKSNKAEFSEIARRYSQSHALDGGDMGWLPEATLLPEIKAKAALLAKLPKGTFSRPVRTSSGWSIIKLIDSRPERTQTLAEATPAIVNLLRERLFEERKKAYLHDLLAKTPVNVVDPAALKKIFGENP